MLVDGDDDLLGRHAELARQEIQDADVGLVRNQPVDLADVNAGLGAGVAGGAVQHRDGLLEDGLAVHAQEGVASDAAVGDVAFGAEDLGLRAIGMQLGGQDAGLVGSLEDHGAGAVAEQHAGLAVVPVQDARKHLGADDQRAARAPARMKLSAVVSA